MTEETFARELESRADHAFDGAHGAPLTFEGVRATAHGIRRRRRATAAGAVAAAVAAVVLVPTMLTGGTNRSDGPDPAPSPPAGVAAASVLQDGVVTRPDGSTVRLDVDNANVTNYGVLADGRVVVALQDPYVVRVYAGNGSIQSEYPVQSNAITMSADDTAVAWVGQDFRVQVLASGATEPTTMAGIPMEGETPGSIDAVLDAQHLLVGDGNTTTGEITPAGYRALTTSEPLRVSDVSPDGDLWAVSYPDREHAQFGCAGLYDASATMVARTCDTAQLEFAPDGEHLSGALGDNGAWGSVEVFDRELHQVGSFEPEGEGVVTSWGWADADHLLLAVGEGNGNPQWTLVRSSLDAASSEVVEGPVDGPIPEAGATEFRLSE